MLLFQRQPIAAALALMVLTAAAPAAAEENAAARGEYLVRAGGCFSCHTAAGGQRLAGGRALTTPFGTFYSPNITPDRENRDRPLDQPRTDHLTVPAVNDARWVRALVRA
jgi:mono/diheme cytochrome c family protein